MNTDPKDAKSKAQKDLLIQGTPSNGKKLDIVKETPKVEVPKKHSVGDDNEKMRETEVTADPKDKTDERVRAQITNDDKHIVNKHHGEEIPNASNNNNV
jgi:hypothetical protein